MILKYFMNGDLTLLYTNVILFCNMDGFVVNQLVVPKTKIKDHIEMTIVKGKVMFETDSKIFIFQNLLPQLSVYVPDDQMDFENDPDGLHNIPGFNDMSCSGEKKSEKCMLL